MTPNVLLFLAATGMSVRPTFQRAWQRRGVYVDRPDYPPLKESAALLGVDPPLTAPRFVWQTAWRVGRHAMPLLHRWDACAPTDTNVNLWVCWLKAIAGNRRRGCSDGGLAYDLLPSVTRRVVARPLARLYPRLHHQNVAMRTAYLDQAVERELASAAGRNATIVVLGAGFDARALRLESGPARSAAWAEIDLPHVVEQKRRLLGRLVKRRPALDRRVAAISHHPANLTIASEARAALRAALAASTPGGHVIFVIEALLIYLPPEAAATLLSACTEEATTAGASRIALCFADRLPDVPGCRYDDARNALRQAGLELEEASYLPKPGLARHMGVARRE
jgi:O-methyltransferase involved in polyketide biosynthesis